MFNLIAKGLIGTAALGVAYIVNKKETIVRYQGEDVKPEVRAMVVGVSVTTGVAVVMSGINDLLK